MTNEIDDPPSGNLPVVPQLYAVPVIPDELKPEDMTEVLKRMFDLVNDSKSDPARVSAARLLLDRFAPPEDPEQKRREAEERDAAIAEAKSILVEFAASRLAGLHEPPALGADGAPGPTDAADNSA